MQNYYFLVVFYVSGLLFSFYNMQTLSGWQFKFAALTFFLCFLGLLRALVIYLPVRRNILQYIGLYAESKQIIFKPKSSGGWVLCLVTYTFKHTPEIGYRYSEKTQDGQVSVKWDKQEIGALREASGRHVQTFNGTFSTLQILAMIWRFVTDDKNNLHIFNASYLNRQALKMERGWFYFLFNLSPTLSGGAALEGKQPDSTMVSKNFITFWLFALPLGGAGIGFVFGLFFLMFVNHLRRLCEKDNSRINRDEYICLVSEMLRHEKKGNNAEANKIEKRLQNLL